MLKALVEPSDVGPVRPPPRGARKEAQVLALAILQTCVIVMKVTSTHGAFGTVAKKVV
jgi:hypothetical protein